MASIDDLSAALVKADAAGDTQGATTLANAIRSMQSSGASGPPPAAPAAVAAPAQPSLLGSALATANHAVTDLPVVGAPIQWLGDNLAAQTVGRLEGQDPAVWLKNAQAARSANDAANPIAAVAGGLGGNAAATAALGGTNLGGEALGMTGKLLPSLKGGFAPGQILSSGLSQLGLGTVNNMEQGQAPTTAMTNAAGPAAVSAGLPVVSKALGGLAQGGIDMLNRGAQRSATNAAIAGAPDAEALKNAASGLFDKVDQSGVTVNTPQFSQFVKDTVTNAKKMGIDPTLDPKATAAYQRLIGALGDVQANGSELSVSDIHTLRQIAQSAATSTDGRDGMFANQIVKGLDSFITKPGSLSTPNAGAANDLLDAISTWNRASKVGMIQDAITKGQYAASGPENGIRNALRPLLTSPANRRLFSAPEISAIEDVVNGTGNSNALTLLGKFGFGTNGKGMLGGSVGGGIGAGIGGTIGTALGGPVGSMIGGAAGAGITSGLATAAKQASERATLANATRAAQVAATPNIPVAAQRSLPEMLTGGLSLADLIARAKLNLSSGAAAQ